MSVSVKFIFTEKIKKCEYYMYCFYATFLDPFSPEVEVAFSIVYTHKHNSMPKHILCPSILLRSRRFRRSLCRDFYFMKCFDSTIFKLSWSKCIKCNIDLPSLSLRIWMHYIQVDQKCINFIFMASGKTFSGRQQTVNTKKRMSDVYIWCSSHYVVSFMHIEVRHISTKPWTSSKIYDEEFFRRK